jgi:hypothetical protein
MAFKSRKRANRFVPRLQALGERALPSVTFAEADGTLTITGDQAANSIAVADDGTGSAGGIVVVADGVTYASENSVASIVILSGSGADAVEYRVSGDLSSDRSVKVLLGNQHDTFAASLVGDVLDGVTFDLLAKGGNGHDSLSVDATGVDVAAGATMNVDLRGGNGHDTISIDYSGILTGAAAFSARGGNGKDILSGAIALETYTNGETDEQIQSSGSLTVDFRGGNGVDALSLHITGDEALTLVDATANGGHGKDTFDVSDNVTVVDGDKSNNCGR